MCDLIDLFSVSDTTVKGRARSGSKIVFIFLAWLISNVFSFYTSHHFKNVWNFKVNLFRLKQKFEEQVYMILIFIKFYLTRFIQLFLPLKKLSLKGITIGAQIADEVLVLLLLEQQSTSLPLLLTTGVWVRSWSMYCPKAISIVVTLLSGELSLMRVHCVDT